MQRSLISVCISGETLRQWVVCYSEESPWRVSVVPPEGHAYEGEGPDLFEALRAVRLRLQAEGVQLCCNGARINARPSPGYHSTGALLIYLVSKNRRTFSRDVFPLFSPAPVSKVATVGQQDEFWRRVSRRKISLVGVNPVNWYKAVQEYFFGAVFWGSCIDSNGFTFWVSRPVGRRVGG